MTATLQLRPICSACGITQPSSVVGEWLKHPHDTQCRNCNAVFTELAQNPDLIICSGCGQSFIGRDDQWNKQALGQDVFCGASCRKAAKERSAA